MKRVFSLLTLAALVCVVPVFAQNSAAEREVSFQRYDSYFEKNNSGLKGKTSYLVINSQTEFDKVFGAAATMGQNSFLPDNFSDTKLVVATIRRGRFNSTYDVTGVATKGKTLYVRYKVKDVPSSSATFASPLILAVDKGDYSRVVFMENGRRVGAVSLSKPKPGRR